MESIARAKKPIVAIIKISQHVQPIVEHVHIKNPQLYIYIYIYIYIDIYKHVLILGHSIDNLRHINMFLEQVAYNVATWSGTLQEFTNLKVEDEQTKENLSKTNNHLQTCS